MKIKLIDYGAPPERMPRRAYDNDAGADVFSSMTCFIKPGQELKIPLGFGIEIPPGYAGYVFPRTSLSNRGIVCHVPPIDPGYTGECHAIVSNLGLNSYLIETGERIGQLIIMPVVIADFSYETSDTRGTGNFGSTGR